MSKEKTLIIGGGQAACQTATSLKNKKYDQAEVYFKKLKNKQGRTTSLSV